MKKENNINTLEEALKLVEKTFGKGTVMKLGDRPKVDMNVTPSGSLALDRILGVGGYPRGRIIEIFGPESSGKTTLALHAIAECQKQGGQAAFVDAEHSIDPTYAKSLGVDIDDLVLSQPDYGEQALQIVEMLAQSDAFDLIVVDSVAALVPQAELEGEMTDQSVGSQARLMSKALRKIVGVLNQHECTIIFINQLREKVGVIYGNPETTTGGRALKFYASVRMDIRRTEALKDGANVYGNTVNVKIVKNKVSPPFKNCHIDIIYGKGVCQTGEILDIGLEDGILKRAGAWYEYEGNRFANGRENGKIYLEQHPDFKDELIKKIKSKVE